MKCNMWRNLKATIGSHDGFTLLETMIAMVIFAVGIVPILYMQTIAVKDHADSRRNVTMIQGAVTQAETIGPSLKYSAPEFDAGDANTTYEYDSMPVGVPDVKKQGLISYQVRSNELVRGLKIVYVSNKIHEDDDKKYTIAQAIPNLVDPLDNMKDK